jgi:membrane protease YdiL (CAAX protease family)
MDCGGLNHSDAMFCGQCLASPLRGKPVKEGVTRVQQYAVSRTAAPVSSSFQSFDEPLKPLPGKLVGAGVGPITGAMPRSHKSNKTTKWRWPHLWLFGLAAWGVPRLLAESGGAERTFSDMLDATLLLQILGYLLAIGVACFFVKVRHNGDWSTFGIRTDAHTFDEVARGIAFGFVLLGVWAPIGYFLSGSKLSVDSLVRTLIGDTSGLGLLLAGVVLVLGAPIIEELYYRGMLYEKFAQRGKWFAIVGSSVLFVMAHGALLIPPLLLLAFGLAFKRQTKTLWYTMAAHGAWNLGVLILASVVVFSPSKLFTPADDAYTVRHPASWERVSEMEIQAPNVAIDLALGAPSGSFIGVYRFNLGAGWTNADLPKALRTIGEMSDVSFKFDGPPQRGVVVSSELSAGWEMRATARGPEGVKVKSRMLAAIPPGWSQALIFELACPAPSCSQGEKAFDDLLDSFELSS